MKFGLIAGGKLLIQVKVKFEHVYARFPQDAKLSALRVLGHESPELIDGYPSRLGYPRQLKFG